jgi:hypothetical protein
VFAAAALFAAFLTFSASASASVATPAPIAGAGLVGVGVVGAVTYLVWRRRRKPVQD